MSRFRSTRDPQDDPGNEGGHSVRERNTPADTTSASDENLWGATVALATTQRGVVTAAELRAIGVDKDMRDQWMRRKRLHRRFRGVYLLGHPLPPPLALELAALKAAGRDALLARYTAAHLFGWLPAPPEIHVVTVGHRVRKQQALAPHTTPRLDPADRARYAGLPITAPARTIVDLAREVSEFVLERSLQEAMARKQVRPAQVEAALERATDPAGSRLLRALLSGTHGGYSRSEGERVLLGLIRRARLPEPDRNQDIGPWNVDFLWRDRMLVVELDSYDAHTSSWAFDRDHRKTIELERLGYTVRRFTGRQLKREPYLIVAEIARLLAA